MLDLDEIQRDQKQDDTQRPVQEQRQHVGERKRSRAEEMERQHGVARATLHNHEQHQAHRARRERADDKWMTRTKRRPFQQAEHDSTQPQHAQRRADPVDPR